MPLVAQRAAAHKRAVPPSLFDMDLRAIRRDRAWRKGPELFLFERAFEDCLDRLSMVRREFGRALLVGCPDPAWPERLSAYCDSVEVIEPGRYFAQAAGGTWVREDRWSPAPGGFDLCVAVGTFDSVDELPRALGSIRAALAPDSLLLGAMAGGDSLPILRAAMFAADREMGFASPRVHPRIEGPTLAALLSAAGFAMPVVDVDRVRVAYSSFSALVSDLRAMGATNVLRGRSRVPLTRLAFAAAAASFEAAGNGSRTEELVEILNFAAWTPVQNQR